MNAKPMNVFSWSSEWKPVSWLRKVCLCAASLALVDFVSAQDPGEPSGPAVIAQAQDVRTAGSLTQEIEVFFDWRRSVNRATLGGGDITVTGPLGYSQRGTLVSVREVPGPLPLPLDAVGNGAAPDPGGVLVPQPVPVLVATYRVFPSAAHDGPWSPEQNGPYAIYLNAGEVASGSD